ncbi:MAG: DUF3524 domain-containing protein [Chloroflexota bacterium]
MNIWLLSAYHTGSHKSWATGYIRHSRHNIHLLSMAGRFWKWRMQGGAIELAHQAQEQITQGNLPDVILATDMVNIPVFLALTRTSLPQNIPIVYYMHENQLTYPTRPGEKPDFTYAMINWLSQLSADRILFNSHFHLHSWFDALPNLLKHFPDYNHLKLVGQVQAKSSVLPVGIHCGPLLETVDSNAGVLPVAPLIVWNQRWEYDKRPDRFFALLYRLQKQGIAFRLAVAGENFRNVPHEFTEAQERLGEAITHWGYVKEYADYIRLLQSADLVISTADHEFFGISVLEAIVAGAFPLLPNRLSYPELIPAALHPACLYKDDEDLFQKACMRLQSPRKASPLLRDVVMQSVDWPIVAARYDDVLEKIR